MPRATPLILFACLAGAARLHAQPLPTNSQVLARMATECVLVSETLPSTLTLDAPNRLPFIRSAVTAALQAGNLVVYDQGAAGRGEVSLDLSGASVKYERAGKGELRRTVQLSIGVRVVDEQGVVQRDEPCSPTAEDTISRADVSTVEDSPYPETRADVPQTFWRRVVQPAIITAATAAGTILFFSLRSRRSESG